MRSLFLPLQEGFLFYVVYLRNTQVSVFFSGLGTNVVRRSGRVYRLSCVQDRIILCFFCVHAVDACWVVHGENATNERQLPHVCAWGERLNFLTYLPLSCKPPHSTQEEMKRYRACIPTTLSDITLLTSNNIGPKYIFAVDRYMTSSGLSSALLRAMANVQRRRNQGARTRY